MDFYGLLNILMPFLLPIFLGYCFARWMQLSASSLLTLIRCIFLPVIMYNALAARMSINMFLWVALAGVFVAIVGNVIAQYGNRVVNVNISSSSALPNVAYFTGVQYLAGQFEIVAAAVGFALEFGVCVFCHFCLLCLLILMKWWVAG